MTGKGKLFRGPPITFTLTNCSLSEYLLPLYRKLDPKKVVQINGETGEAQTAEEVLTSAIQFAESLTTRKLDEDDVVAFLGFNSPNLFTGIQGCLLNNTPHFPLDPSLKQIEIERMFQVCKPSIVFTDAAAVSYVVAALDSCENSCEVFLLDSNETDSERVRPFKEFLRLDADLNAFKARTVKNPQESTAYILGSSGTTGFPKAMEITHTNCIYNLQVWQPDEIKNYDKYLQITQTHWLTGHCAVFFTPVHGIQRIYVSKVTPDILISSIDKYKPNGGFITPLLLKWIANHPQLEKYDVSSIKYFQVGGSPLTQAAADEIKSKWPNPDLFMPQVYGSTETTGSISLGDANIPITSAGKVTVGMTVKVVDGNTGELLGANEIGELRFKSQYGMMKGYMKNPEATAAAFDNEGFYRSGDVGYIDENNAIFITGRCKDIIKYRNYQVAPYELEEVISEMEAVQETIVVGIPHESDFYHARAAVVKVPGSKITEQDVINYVAEKLSESKHLYGGVKFVESIPRNSNGKVLRDLVKEILMEK